MGAREGPCPQKSRTLSGLEHLGFRTGHITGAESCLGLSVMEATAQPTQCTGLDDDEYLVR